ncbi:MAG: Eco57I restriction-modification methylase domain-containing protein, partial [Phormidesmis sp. CAN_BIN44]|nr:Eco57I restriction-modification methylase domain-containing protein [Phormidesmis sp. CAN_BIN44]
FDVVIGNPPYVRQELLTPFKSYLQQHYESYDGVADLYAYFYEKGLKILKPDGILSFIVTNKWFKAGYGESLRRFFSQNSVFEQILDFGHAPIFEDADTFPCIVSVRSLVTKPEPEMTKQSPDLSVRVCPVPREKLQDINLSQFVQQEGFEVPWSRFTTNAWSLDPVEVDALMQKVKNTGVTLKAFVGAKPLCGIKTGCNEIYLVTDEVKQRLVRDDPRATEVIKPYLRGQDIKRWKPDWQKLWIILLKSSANYQWKWARSSSLEEAEQVFAQEYPSVYAYIKPHEERLKNRSDQGIHWWELRSCIYYNVFEQSKIIWQDLSFHSRFCFGKAGLIAEMTCFALPSSDLWLLAVLNSPLMWCWLWRNTVHGKDEVLRLKNIYTENIPIAEPSENVREQVEPIVTRLIEITKANQEANREVQDWLQVEQHIEKLGQKLEDFSRLDCDLFVQEVKIRKPKGSTLNPKALKELREVYNDYAPHIQTRRAEALAIEIQLSDLVNQA